MSKAFLGRGWKFPVEVDPTTGRIRTSEHEEDIKEAIRIIMATSKGERVMRADFGCGIHHFVFESTDETTLKMLEHTVADAIRIWEPRVHEVEVNARIDPSNPGLLNLNVAYVVRSTNNLFNLVYPFYLHEGLQ